MGGRGWTWRFDHAEIKELTAYVVLDSTAEFWLRFALALYLLTLKRRILGWSADTAITTDHTDGAFLTLRLEQRLIKIGSRAYGL